MLNKRTEIPSTDIEIKDEAWKTEKRTYTVTEIQEMLGISSPTAYGLIKKNLFRTIRIGRNIRISKKSFDEWLDSSNSI